MQEANPLLLSYHPPTTEERLRELARRGGVRAFLIGDQHSLFDTEVVPMVEVVSGSTRFTCSRAAAQDAGIEVTE